MTAERVDRRLAAVLAAGAVAGIATAAAPLGT